MSDTRPTLCAIEVRESTARFCQTHRVAFVMGNDPVPFPCCFTDWIVAPASPEGSHG